MNVTVDPIRTFRQELHSAARRQIVTRRRRLTALAAALVAGALVSGLSIAGTGWLTGEPAPTPVVRDFQAYTPQLGFHPEPGKAVFVAQDGPVKLYATTNREGTYCLVLDEPWKHADAGDGGSCVPKRYAAQPITAGVGGVGDISKENTATYVVTGRVINPKAETIRFADAWGSVVERHIGSSGFFVATLHGKIPFLVVRPRAGHKAACSGRDWAPTFTALSSSGERLGEATIPLVRYTGACTAGFEVTPHGP